MKYIVLYLMVFTTGLLMMAPEAAGQKSTIDLLPSDHLRIHPEAMDDSGGTRDTLMNVDRKSHSDELESGEKETKTFRRKENRRNWFHMDSLFHKKEAGSKRPFSRSGKPFLILKYFNPLHFFIHITALKL